jgi:hypothetical protein
MIALANTPAASVLPVVTLGVIGRMAAAGSIATAAFDWFGQSLSPMLGFANLAPMPLATEVWNVLFGTAYEPGGHLLHYVAGLVGYPIGWTFVAAPIAALVAPRLPVAFAVLAYGVGLWVFAMYFMATLVAGQPAFLGWTGITWVALVGHVLFAVVYAAAMQALSSLRDGR